MGNPRMVGDSQTFAISAPGSEEVFVEIIDVAGRSVSKWTAPRTVNGIAVTRWDVENRVGAASGVYFVRVPEPVNDSETLAS
ncbi:MAG: T9SS type A sorting domain-containing protein [Candidatus Eiseniibacteriota bacterium]